MKFLPFIKKKEGYMLAGILVFASIAVIILTGVISFASSIFKYVVFITHREQAFQIAEAGIDYYRWHLAHSPTDYQDDTGIAGPYTHFFHDKTGNYIGDFILTITPPPTGSTIVTIQSEGIVATSSISNGIKRKIRTRLAIPSFAKYAFVANDVMRFGEGTVVTGPIQSNEGIRFDGLAHNLVSSSKGSYNDPDHSGANEFGVHTHVKPPPQTGIYTGAVSAESPPHAVDTRPDVFLAGRKMSVPAVDFDGITSDLATMKSAAQSNGRYLEPSGANGYHIIFYTNDTIRVYKINNLRNTPSHCTNTQDQSGWGTWSIGTSGGSESLVGNYPLPANGIIFVEDNVWVNGQINSARVTVASGRFPDNPTTRTSITINEDLYYSNYDGTDTLALIAQNNINAGLYSENDLRIDAALIAQNGRVGRYYYEGDCGSYRSRDSLSLYGMIASNVRYGFAYTDGSGYDQRTITYDGYLLYAPPPFFPLTSDQYQTISWEEIK